MTAAPAVLPRSGEESNGPFGRGIALVTAVWAASRCLAVCVLLLTAEQVVLGDVTRYFEWSDGAWAHHILPGRDFPWEYPPGALLCLLIPVGRSGVDSYFAVFLAVWLLLDLGFTLFLHDLGRRRGSMAGTVLWLAVIPALGPVALARYDITPAALTTVAAAVAGSFPATAGVLVTVAASMKVWPLVVLAVLLLFGRSRSRIVLGGLLTLLVLTAVGWWVGVLPAFTSSIRYQLERGSQAESIAALPILWWRRFGGTAHVGFSHGAWEISGPGAASFAVVLSAASAVGLVALFVSSWRRSRQGFPPDLLLSSAAAVTILLLGDKVFSPQYLLWLCSLLAGAACRANAVSRSQLWLTLVVALLSHLVYPLLYNQMLGGDLLPLLLLTARDSLLCLLCFQLVRTCLRRQARIAEQPVRGISR